MKPGDTVFLAEALHFSLKDQFGLPLLVIQDLDIDKSDSRLVQPVPMALRKPTWRRTGRRSAGRSWPSLRNRRFPGEWRPGLRPPVRRSFSLYAANLDDIRADAENQETTSLKRQFIIE